MKNSILLLFSIIFSFVLHAQNEDNKYIIKGENIPKNLNGMTAYLHTSDSTLTLPYSIVDSAIISNEQFTMEGNVKWGPSIAILSVDENWFSKDPQQYQTTFILASGETVFSYDPPSIRSDNPISNSYQDFIDVAEKSTTQLLNLNNEYKDRNTDSKRNKEYEVKRDKLGEDFNTTAIQYIGENINSRIAVALLSRFYYQFESEKVLQLISKMPIENQSLGQIPKIRQTYDKQPTTCEGKMQ